MKQYFSSYLDLARLTAAVLVVLDHYVGQHIVGANAARFFPAMGREAVIIFFVLSGFVIAYVTDEKKQSLKQYGIARAARIYSVAFPLLLTAFALIYTTQLYTGKAIGLDYQIARAYFYIPFHSLFLGELWTISEKPLWLEAYWSLGYEVWYYIFFAAIFFLRGGKRRVCGTVVFLVLGYKLWLLLPIWYSGVLLWRLRNRFLVDKYLARAGWILSLVLLCAYKYFGCDDYLRIVGNALWPFSQFPLGSADRYVGDYAVCAMVLLNFYCALHVEVIFPNKLAGLVTKLASYTFPLYLTHGLVMWLWRYFHSDGGGWANIALLTLAVACATYAVGLASEYFRSRLVLIFTRLCDFFEATAYLVAPALRGGNKR
jgi:peptidoglycan/LPS O-acetylase OafA/YrhL